MGIGKESGQKKVQYAFRRMGMRGTCKPEFGIGMGARHGGGAGPSHPSEWTVSPLSAWSCGPVPGYLDAWEENTGSRRGTLVRAGPLGPSSSSGSRLPNTNQEFYRRNRQCVKGGERRCAATRLSQNDKVSRR